MPLEVCGWRIVRRLPATPGRRRMLAAMPGAAPGGAGGAAAESWLAAAPIEGPVAPGELVELVIDEPAAGGLSLAAELDLLDRLGLAFAPPLIDSSADARGRLVAVRPRVAATGPELLEHAPLAAPAAVSLLAPIIETIAALHDGGWTHGAMTLGAIGVDPHGRPMIRDWHGLRERRGRDAGRLEPAAADDWRAVGAVIAALALGSGAQGGDERLRAAVGRCRAGETEPEIAEVLLDALFEWSPGGPIPDLGGAGAPGGQDPERIEVGPSLLLAAGHELDDELDRHRVAPRRRAARRRDAAAVGPEPETGRAAIAELLRRGAAGTRSSVGSARRAALVIGAGACLALSIAILALGAGPGTADAAPTTTSSGIAAARAASSTFPGSDVEQPSGGAPTAAPTAAGPAGETPGGGAASAPAGEAARAEVLRGDDPVAAAALLLAERDAALAAGDAAALAGAYAAQAPGLERDLARLGAATPTAPASAPTGPLELEDRYGGYAIVADGGRRASLVEGPGGWRLREVMEGR